MITKIVPWMYVLGGITCSSLAQICIKRATLIGERDLAWLSYLLSSISFYGLSFVAYYLALKVFPISKIAPVMTVGVVMVIVCYGAWTGEAIHIQQVAGLALGTISIFLILS